MVAAAGGNRAGGASGGQCRACRKHGGNGGAAAATMVELMSAADPVQRRMAVSALQRLVCSQPSAAGQLAATDGIAEMLVQLLASQVPPANCQEAWEAAEAASSLQAMLLLGEAISVDPSSAYRPSQQAL